LAVALDCAIAPVALATRPKAMSARQEIFLKFMMNSFLGQGVRSEATNRFAYALVPLAANLAIRGAGGFQPQTSEPVRIAEPLSGTPRRNLKGDFAFVTELTARKGPLSRPRLARRA
jgi:hypothetical protein